KTSCVSKNGGILLANSNQLYFNHLVKTPCHKMSYRCPYRLNLTSQRSRSCAHLNIKILKDRDLEFANSIREVNEPLFAAAVPMTKEAETRVIPAHCENGGDTSGTR